MGLFLGFAYILFVFGPATVLYFTIIAKKSETNLIAISSAFVWLVSVLPPSVLQIINGGVIDNTEFIPLYILITAIFQEIGRFLFVRTYFKLEKKIMEKGRLKRSLFSDLTSAISAGFGFGVLNALVWHGGAISAAFTERDNGDIYGVDTCDGVSAYLISAWHALQFQPLHIALSILMFHAFRSRQMETITDKSLNGRVIFIAMVHIFIAMLSSLNLIKKGCDAEIPLVFISVCATCFYTYRTVKGSSYNVYGKGEVA